MIDESLSAIVVAGVSSGAGKTSVAETLTGVLSKMCRTAAAKITVTHGERGCPHGGKGCNVCSSLGGDFQLIDREAIITQQGTDTARLRAAGASPVVWAITKDVAIQAAWAKMRGMLSGAACAVIESTTLTEHIRPALTFMIVDPTVSRKIWKPSAERLIASADYLILNHRGTFEQNQSMLKEINRLRPHAKTLIHVSHPHEIARDETIIDALNHIASKNEQG
ncbi:MAG: hypothetical protein JOZ52_10690 [Acidobacteria bacterium]|nr:hypothetical protein [Acidobacteriota bacterium]